MSCQRIGGQYIPFVNDAFELLDPRSAEAFLKSFDSETRRRGNSHFQKGHVYDLEPVQGGASYTATVQSGEESHEVDLEYDGFPLQGGRLDVIRGKTVAVLVYGRRKHIINVFVWPTAERDETPQQGSQLGYNWIDWRKGGMEFSAISDVSAPDLTELQKLIAQ